MLESPVYMVLTRVLRRHRDVTGILLHAALNNILSLIYDPTHEHRGVFNVSWLILVWVVAHAITHLFLVLKIVI